MKKLENKVALITGATSGIGKATAINFIENGAKVIITGRDKDRVDETVKELGSGTIGFVSDAGKMNDLLGLAEQVKAVTASIDILYINAGFGQYASIEQVTEESYNEQFDVMVKGTLFTVQQIVPLMKEGSSIILNTSVVTEVGMKDFSVYSAAKAAVQSFVKTFAADLAYKNIRVNGVSPGPIRTNFFHAAGMSAEAIENTNGYLSSQVPLSRLGEPSDVAKAVTFLASDDSSFIHGTEIFVDGGFPRISK